MRVGTTAVPDTSVDLTPLIQSSCYDLSPRSLKVKVRGGLVVISRHRGKRVAGSKPYSSRVHCLWGPFHIKQFVVAKRPPDSWLGSLVKEQPAHVSSSSSDRSSKLRGPSQNSSQSVSRIITDGARCAIKRLKEEITVTLTLLWSTIQFPQCLPV
ncbi:hypothetical protein AVEN_33898-1 [Araneus ventricosus]|uniref:Uncharacterized protein n=1 Tax=Araneus ventricosus TaxID=182803 RepID=A0A4Y2EH11_ARAVE|nr:hypothetical protein AVEN_33898-1 [Araneus ventricosus]